MFKIISFKTLYISLTVFTLLIAPSTLSEFKFSVETIVGAIYAVRQYTRSGCVFFLYAGSPDLRETVFLERLERYVSRLDTPTAVIRIHKVHEAFNCTHNRPLFVAFFSSNSTQQLLQKIAISTDLSAARWLFFTDSQPVEKYFNSTIIPLDCLLITAHILQKETVIFTEVYYISRYQRLQESNIGKWNRETGSLWTNVTFYERRADLQGVTINVAVISDGAICHITEFKENKPVKIGGFFGTLWVALQSRLNFTSEYIKPTDGGYGSLRNDTWSGMIGMLVRKETDVAVGAYVMTERLIKYVNFVSPMGATKIAVFMRRPSFLSGTKWNSYLAPFATTLWLAVSCAILILTVGLITTAKAGHKIGNEEVNSNKRYSTFNSFIYIFGCFCQQGHERTPKSWSCRLVYLTAYLTAVVILSAYSATFISFLTVRYSSLPFTSFEGMLRDGTYKLGILEGSVEVNFFDQTTRQTVLQEVYLQLIQPNLHDSPTDTLAGLQRVCDQRKYGFVCDSTRAASVVNNLTCEVVPLPNAFIPATGTFVIGKHCPYRRLINSKLESMRRHGELGRLFIHAMPSKTKDTSATTLIKVRVAEVLPVFAMLALSILIGSAFLAAERYLFRLTGRRRNQRKLLHPLCWVKYSGIKRNG